MRVSLVVEVGVDRSVCLNVCFFTFVASIATVLFLGSCFSLSFFVSGICGPVSEFRPESCEFVWYSCSGPLLPHRAWFPSFPVFGGRSEWVGENVGIVNLLMAPCLVYAYFRCRFFKVVLCR